MANFTSGRRGRSQWPLWSAYGAAGVLGAVLGWDFGTQVGGPMIAVVAAFCCAAFCVLIMGSIVERVVRWRSSRGTGT